MKPSFLVSSLFLSAVSASFSGSGTFYEPGGLFGSCGQTIQNSDLSVALNVDQYTSADCFKTITITSGTKTTQAVIKDECIACNNNGLDMTPGLFEFFAPLQDGEIPITWSFV